MKIIRFELDGEVKYGEINQEEISVLNGDIETGFTKSGVITQLDKVKLLAPVMPGKAVCVGLNYKDHIEEMSLESPTQPVLFMKPASAVIGPQAVIEKPAMSNRVDFEGEFAIVIGKKAKNVNADDAEKFVFGYTCANDITARDLQMPTGQWTIAKGFDTFLPIGPCIETELDPQNLAITTWLNGKVVQKSNTKELLFDVKTLVSFISSIMTLDPGDIILTGTPSGIAPMSDGDIIEVEIEKIGKLTNIMG